MKRKPRHTVSFNHTELDYIIRSFGKLRMEDDPIVNKFINAQQALGLKNKKWSQNEQDKKRTEENDIKTNKRTKD